MQKEEIINTLRNEMTILKSQYGVQSIGLFGSYAKGKNTDDSDLDFLVELDVPIADNYFGLWDFLEKRFQKKIDLVRRGRHLSERFLNAVHAEIVYV